MGAPDCRGLPRDLSGVCACMQLKTDEQKKAFTRLVKRVAKLVEVPPGSGTNFIVLRNPDA